MIDSNEEMEVTPKPVMIAIPQEESLQASYVSVKDENIKEQLEEKQIEDSDVLTPKFKMNLSSQTQ